MIRYQTHVRTSRKSHCQFHFIYKILLFIVYFFGPARTSLEKVVDFREVQLWEFLKKRSSLVTHSNWRKNGKCLELEGVENCIINFIEYTCTLYVEISKSMIWTSFGIERYDMNIFRHRTLWKSENGKLRLGKSRTFQHLLSTGLKMGTVCTLQRRSNWDFREINPSPPPLLKISLENSRKVE